MIQFLHVTHTYDATWTGIRDVTFRMDAGEFVFLTGPSGAGKSTILKHIYMEELPDPLRGGRVLVTIRGDRVYDSHGISRARIQKLRRHVGVVFQEFRLLTDRNVYENVAFALRVAGHDGKALRRRVDTVLDLVGLRHRTRSHPHDLSGGERQKVAIARAVANDPEIVLADEPTGNLDSRSAEGVLDLFRHLHARGTTILMATHDQLLLNRWPFRRLVMEQGNLRSRDDL